MTAPERADVWRWLTALVAGEITREEASTAASPWIGEREAEVVDDSLWRPLSQLAGADLTSCTGEYLYNVLDFEAWLTEFDEASE